MSAHRRSRPTPAPQRRLAGSRGGSATSSCSPAATSCTSRREPLQLSDVTVQPVLFTLLFVYVFGAGVVLPGGGSYKDFAIAGLLALNLTTSAMGTAVGLSTDLNSGVIDRFRTLPMWRAAVLAGRIARRPARPPRCAPRSSPSPASSIGWRPDASIGVGASPGSALFLLFSYALSWVMRAASASSARAPNRRRASGSSILFPLAVRLQRAGPDPAHARRSCRSIADWNPVSAVTAAARRAVRQPQPVGVDRRLADAAPGARLAPVVGRAAAVFAPLASSLYRRRTTD